MKFLLLISVFNLLVKATPITPIKQQIYINFELIKSDIGLFYIENLNLGTPKQILNKVEIDTGSSDFILANDDYNPSKSSSVHNTFEIFTTSYGSISPFQFYKIYDTLSFKNFEIENYPVGFAQNVSSDYFGNFNGILGLGTGLLEAMEPSYSNFPRQLKESGLIDYILFSIYAPVSGNNTILFGGINSDVFHGPLIKIPINFAIGQTSSFKKYNWSGITINGIKIGDTVVSNENSYFEIDTGATTFVPPDNIARNILQLLIDESKGDYLFQDNSDGGYYYFRRELVGDLWITFNVQGYILKFQIDDLLLNETAGDSINQNGNTYCILDMMLGYQLGLNTNVQTIPNHVLKYSYIVWDYEQFALYFADLIDLNDKPDTKSIVEIRDNQWPISTTTAPDATNTYTSFYWASNDVSISGKYSLTVAGEENATSEPITTTTSSSSIATGGCYAIPT
ncbi:unnamed protein product [Candida verbasci]|uniref:Peptidase A1 domain-containing protein n=1 Tax=Candida verbasci TaxID=1227364 RepID=A0A9W4XC42_9ASCO|nr:unnamed protein product [Candida verbasci]